jgi:glycolate oxidase iron-sulfur subunit
MCLPQCPTYQHAQDENESPRGRLVLGKALLRGELKADARIKQHIDNCLLCRQCERVCPSGVQFGYFMDGLRQHLCNSHEPAGNKLETLLEDSLEDRGRSKRLHHLLRFVQVSGVQKVAGLLPGKPGRLARSLPTISGISTQQHHYPAQTPGQQARLFRGCTQTVFGSALFDTSIRLLNRLGVSVEVPPQQGCCGALSQHSGNAQRASELAATNLEAFTTDQAIPIITLASGCAASLKDYAQHADEYPGARQFAQQVTDISHYLLSLEWPADVSIQPLSKRIVVHSPCSLRNVLRQDKAVANLLGRIPAAEVLPLETAGNCCGAAGSYMFEDEHRHLSDSLADETTEQVRRLEADLVVTSNIGCAMQLQAGLTRAGLAIEVLHPVELLARQLGLD